MNDKLMFDTDKAKKVCACLLSSGCERVSLTQLIGEFMNNADPVIKKDT